jgi:hypothetical protein
MKTDNGLNQVLGIDFTETPETFLCQHIHYGRGEVNNALENEVLLIILLIGGPGIRFYAGAVIQDANGFTFRLTLCD